MPHRSLAPDLILAGGIVFTMNAHDLTATVLGDQDRITIREALRSYTIGGANATGRERTVGSPEPGKLADLVALEQDPLSIPVDQLKNVRPLATMLGGRWVFDRR